MIRKSLSDFASDEINERANGDSKVNTASNFDEEKSNQSYVSDENSSAQQTAEQILNKYSTYSKGQFEDEIKDRVNALKQSGQFDKQKLLSSFQMIEGFLSPEQRAQMLGMIEGLDEKN